MLEDLGETAGSILLICMARPLRAEVFAGLRLEG
jgi:hypothetical protein